MPETPDFASIALTLHAVLNREELEPSEIDEAVAILKRLWNARGAADIVKLDDELSVMLGTARAEPFRRPLDRALRSLDR